MIIGNERSLLFIIYRLAIKLFRNKRNNPGGKIDFKAGASIVAAVKHDLLRSRLRGDKDYLVGLIFQNSLLLELKPLPYTSILSFMVIKAWGSMWNTSSFSLGNWVFPTVTIIIFRALPV